MVAAFNRGIDPSVATARWADSLYIGTGVEPAALDLETKYPTRIKGESGRRFHHDATADDPDVPNTSSNRSNTSMPILLGLCPLASLKCSFK